MRKDFDINEILNNLKIGLDATKTIMTSVSNKFIETSKDVSKLNYHSLPFMIDNITDIIVDNIETMAIVKNEIVIDRDDASHKMLYPIVSYIDTDVFFSFVQDMKNNSVLSIEETYHSLIYALEEYTKENKYLLQTSSEKSDELFEVLLTLASSQHYDTLSLLSLSVLLSKIIPFSKTLTEIEQIDEIFEPCYYAYSFLTKMHSNLLKDSDLELSIDAMVVLSLFLMMTLHLLLRTCLLMVLSMFSDFIEYIKDTDRNTHFVNKDALLFMALSKTMSLHTEEAQARKLGNGILKDIITGLSLSNIKIGQEDQIDYKQDTLILEELRKGNIDIPETFDISIKEFLKKDIIELLPDQLQLLLSLIDDIKKRDAQSGM